MSLTNLGLDPVAVRKSVYYEGTSTVERGMPVCYNYDTTNNWWGKGPATFGVAATEQGTTAEGEQNEGKWQRVENAATANFFWFAGVVDEGSWVGKAGPCQLNVLIPNGAIVPVRCKVSTTVGVTALGLSNGLTYLDACTGDNDPVPVATAMETVNRSSTEGLVLARLDGVTPQVTAMNALFAPRRHVATGDAAGIRVYLDSLFTSSGATGPRTYGLYITGDRGSDYALTTAGCDDAAIRVNTTNYAVNGEVFNWRGLNVRIANRGGGVVGELSNTITAFVDDDDSDGTETAIIKALALETYQESPDTPDEMGVLDVCVCREGGVATTEYGIQIRTRGTINVAVNAAIRLTKDATDHGFVNLFNIETDAVDFAAATVEAAHVLGFDGDGTAVQIPIVVNGATYYLLAGTATALVADA